MVLCVSPREEPPVQWPAAPSLSAPSVLDGKRLAEWGLSVLVVRYGTTYYATNRLTLPAAEIRRLYRLRAQIDEVIRVCKDQLGLNSCQARAERAPLHHRTCGLVAFCVLECERHDRRLTIYQLKRHLSCHGRTVDLPALERLRQAA